ncbi:MAG: glycoside hydrolase family 31 protein [Fimbriimonas sp.]|nr:glycoside hydrolase family 31 protein [Fimbriimonas sp.]
MPTLRALVTVCLIGSIARSFATSGLTLAINGGLLNVTPITDRIVRVAYAMNADFFTRSSLAVLPQAILPKAKWKLESRPSEWVLTTAALQVHVDRATSAVSFYDPKGKRLTAELPDGRTLEPSEVQGQRTFHPGQRWATTDDEALYGLGQNQLGLLDIKGYDLDLWQHNTSIAIPFLVSSRGYGILWDNPSFTRFGDLRAFSSVPSSQLLGLDGKPGGLSATYFSGPSFAKFVGSRKESDLELGSLDPTRPSNRPVPYPGLPRGPFSVRWEGTIVAPQSGDFQFQTYSHSGIRVWISYGLMINHWRQNWLPWYDAAKVHLIAGQRVPIKIEYIADQGQPLLQFKWKTPPPKPATSLWSEVGDGTDYYFAYGPGMDQVIGGYRQLTGQAPMMPRWAFGLFQSRQRYETSGQSIGVVDGFRSRGIPFDTIVQDWFYWKADDWGSHEFDPTRFPDPAGWIRTIHDRHAKLMISVWPKFYPGTSNFREMQSKGFLYKPNLTEGLRDWTRHLYTFYDAFNPDARKLFWNQVDRELMHKNVDAWWMDASEPDLLPSPTLEGTKTHMNPTAMGPATRVLNAYPLVNAQAIYEGQRKDAPDKRVFILTRSGYAGLQRYGAANWSGDITSTWTAMRKQIAAGLSYSISGLPYWTMDSGGFSVPARFSSRNPRPEDRDEWNELNTRWFEFATFVPFLRVHGEFPYREMWQFGGESSPAYRAQLKFDKLRYRYLPYIYSVDAMVHREHGTMMRPLIMDFPNDPQVRKIDDQYMFGPSILVNPVTSYRTRSRMVYLPDTPGGWYDLWDAKWHEGGKSELAPAPYDAIPLYVKAGSIVPIGPEVQFTGQDPEGPVTLYVCTGANAKFTIYDDDGVSYGYEKGQCSTIPVGWDEKRRILTIGARKGSFPGMAEHRSFAVLFLTKGGTAGFRQISYDGKSTTLAMP